MHLYGCLQQKQSGFMLNIYPISRFFWVLNQLDRTVNFCILLLVIRSANGISTNAFLFPKHLLPLGP